MAICIDVDRRRRRIQLQNILLQELNNCEEEDRCVDKFHTLFQLAQTNSLQTISSFVQALAECQSLRTKDEDETSNSIPPIVVKLPTIVVKPHTGSRKDIIKQRKRTRTRKITQFKIPTLNKKIRKPTKNSIEKVHPEEPSARASSTVVVASERPDTLMPRTIITISSETSDSNNPNPNTSPPFQQSFFVPNYPALPELHTDLESSNFVLRNIASTLTPNSRVGSPEVGHHFHTFQLLQESVRLESGEEIYIVSCIDDEQQNRI